MHVMAVNYFSASLLFSLSDVVLRQISALHHWRASARRASTLGMLFNAAGDNGPALCTSDINGGHCQPEATDQCPPQHISEAVPTQEHHTKDALLGALS